MVQRASGQPAAAAIAGEKDKLHRYGPEVLPFAVETFGRLGPKAEEFLVRLDAAARRLDDLKGWPQRDRRARWNARLSVVVQRAIARQLLEARGIYAREGPARARAAEARSAAQDGGIAEMTDQRAAEAAPASTRDQAERGLAVGSVSPCCGVGQ